MSRLETPLPPSWTTPLRPPTPWKECNTDDAPPESWKTIFDPMYKKYASHWLWKAQQIWERLQDDPLFFEYQPADKKRLEDGWLRLHRHARDYASAVSSSKKKRAREIAFAIEIASLSFYDLKGRSDIAAKQKLVWAKKTQEASEGFKEILSKQNIYAKILVAGKTRADCNVGYREGALRSLIHWLEGCYRNLEGPTPEQRIFWLHGEPGCGKSVIAHYIAKLCNDLEALAAGYVFEQGFNQKKWAGLTATFASDFISYFGDAFKVGLIEKTAALPYKMEDFFALEPSFQFELLTAAWHALPVEERKPMLIVLDDLDRCDQWSIREICDLIRESIAAKTDLPVYWIVSSCDTTDIRNNLIKRKNLGDQVTSCYLPLYDAEPRPDSNAENDEPPTPKPHQSFNIRTPTAASFDTLSTRESPVDEVEVLPLVSAMGALYGHDESLRRANSRDSTSSESLDMVLESEDED